MIEVVLPEIPSYLFLVALTLFGVISMLCLAIIMWDEVKVVSGMLFLLAIVLLVIMLSSPATPFQVFNITGGLAI